MHFRSWGGSPMTRTFSLRWLFAAVTIVCVASALAAAFPQAAMFLGLQVGFLVPAIVITTVFAVFSRPRWPVVVAGVVGAWIGGAASSVFIVSMFEIRAYNPNAPPTLWDSHFKDWLIIAGCCSLAAAVTCVLVMQFSGKQSPGTSDPPQCPTPTPPPL